MKLVPEWKRLLRRAWSIRFLLLATLLGCVEALLPYFADQFPRGVFAVLMVAASVAALIARLVAQPRMHDDAR